MSQALKPLNFRKLKIALLICFLSFSTAQAEEDFSNILVGFESLEQACPEILKSRNSQKGLRAVEKITALSGFTAAPSGQCVFPPSIQTPSVTADDFEESYSQALHRLKHDVANHALAQSQNTFLDLNHRTLHMPPEPGSKNPGREDPKKIIQNLWWKDPKKAHPKFDEATILDLERYGENYQKALDKNVTTIYSPETIRSELNKRILEVKNDPEYTANCPIIEEPVKPLGSSRSDGGSAAANEEALQFEVRKQKFQKILASLDCRTAEEALAKYKPRCESYMKGVLAGFLRSPMGNLIFTNSMTPYFKYFLKYDGSNRLETQHIPNDKIIQSAVRDAKTETRKYIELISESKSDLNGLGERRNDAGILEQIKDLMENAPLQFLEVINRPENRTSKSLVFKGAVCDAFNGLKTDVRLRKRDQKIYFWGGLVTGGGLALSGIGGLVLGSTVFAGTTTGAGLLMAAEASQLVGAAVSASSLAYNLNEEKILKRKISLKIGQILTESKKNSALATQHIDHRDQDRARLGDVTSEAKWNASFLALDLIGIPFALKGLKTTEQYLNYLRSAPPEVLKMVAKNRKAQNLILAAYRVRGGSIEPELNAIAKISDPDARVEALSWLSKPPKSKRGLIDVENYRKKGSHKSSSKKDPTKASVKLNQSALKNKSTNSLLLTAAKDIKARIDDPKILSWIAILEKDHLLTTDILEYLLVMNNADTKADVIMNFHKMLYSLDFPAGFDRNGVQSIFVPEQWRIAAKHFDLPIPDAVQIKDGFSNFISFYRQFNSDISDAFNSSEYLTKILPYFNRMDISSSSGFKEIIPILNRNLVEAPSPKDLDNLVRQLYKDNLVNPLAKLPEQGLTGKRIVILHKLELAYLLEQDFIPRTTYDVGFIGPKEKPKPKVNFVELRKKIPKLKFLWIPYSSTNAGFFGELSVGIPSQNTNVNIKAIANKRLSDWDVWSHEIGHIQTEQNHGNPVRRLELSPKAYEKLLNRPLTNGTASEKGYHGFVRLDELVQYHRDSQAELKKYILNIQNNFEEEVDALWSISHDIYSTAEVDVQSIRRDLEPFQNGFETIIREIRNSSKGIRPTAATIEKWTFDFSSLFVNQKNLTKEEAQSLQNSFKGWLTKYASSVNPNALQNQAATMLESGNYRISAKSEAFRDSFFGPNAIKNYQMIDDALSIALAVEKAAKRIQDMMLSGKPVIEHIQSEFALIQATFQKFGLKPFNKNLVETYYPGAKPLWDFPLNRPKPSKKLPENYKQPAPFQKWWQEQQGLRKSQPPG